MSRSKVQIDIKGNNQNFKRSLGEIKKQTRDLETSLKSIATRGAVAFAGLGAGIGFAVTEAAKFEQINTQFQVLIGNAEDAEKALTDLKDFSAGTPFQFESIAKAGQQLLGFGFAADELRPRLEEIGNVAAAVGKPIDEIGLIFGQVAAAGKLTGERLLQFQERAIPIGPAIAETLGVAESAVKDLVSKGAVDFATFQKAFASLSKEGGVAFGALDKQSQTLSGQFSTLKDNVSLLVADFGQQFFPVIKAVTSAVTSFIRVLRDNPELVKYGAAVIGVTAALTGLVTAVSGSILVFIKVKAVILAAAAASPLLSAGLTGISTAATLAGTALKFAFANPIGIAITALVALTATAFAFRKEISAGFGAAGDVVRGFVERASENLNGFRKLLQGIATFNFSLAKEGFEQLFDLSGEGEKAADTFAKSYAKRMEAFKEEEATRQEDLKTIRLEKQSEENEAKLEQEAEFRDRQAELKVEKDEVDLELEAARLNAQEILNKSSEKNREKNLKKAKSSEIRIEQQSANAKVELAQATANLVTTVAGRESKLAFAISKGAAIAQSIISTRLASAQALATPPGPPSTFPLAAQVEAAGKINTAAIIATAIQGFNQGGLVQGGRPGIDSVPALLTPGELVTPKKNFDEVVNAVANSRASGGSDGGQQLNVTIGFTDDAFEIIEEKLIERRVISQALGTI